MRDNAAHLAHGSSHDSSRGSAHDSSHTSSHALKTESRPGASVPRLSRRLSRLSDDALLRRLARLAARDRVTTASLLAHIAEVDARRLYAPAGYASMHAYCVGELRLSEDAASKRIQVARAGRRVPALLEALIDGRLHLSGARLLAPFVVGDNAGDLIEAATHRTKAEIEEMLMRRFSAPWDLGPGLGRAGDADEHAPGHVDLGSDGDDPMPEGPVDKGNLAVDEHAPGHVAGFGAAAVTLSPECVSLHVAISRSTQEKLRYAQALLSHAVPSGDPAEVLDRALDALIEKIEKRRFGAKRGRVTRREGAKKAAAASRYIRTQVRREVWERDGGRCTFVGRNGHRCKERRFLEFDHMEPVARGGTATVQNLRLRCRTHNQYEAERTLGAGFMEIRRREAREAREARTTREARQAQDARRARNEPRGARATSADQVRDIQAGLRGLGCRADSARRAAERAAALLPGATLEEQLRQALRALGRMAIGTTIPAPERPRSAGSP